MPPTTEQPRFLAGPHGSIEKIYTTEPGQIAQAKRLISLDLLLQAQLALFPADHQNLQPDPLTPRLLTSTYLQLTNASEAFLWQEQPKAPPVVEIRDARTHIDTKYLTPLSTAQIISTQHDHLPPSLQGILTPNQWSAFQRILSSAHLLADLKSQHLDPKLYYTTPAKSLSELKSQIPLPSGSIWESDFNQAVRGYFQAHNRYSPDEQVAEAGKRTKALARFMGDHVSIGIVESENHRYRTFFITPDGLAQLATMSPQDHHDFTGVGETTLNDLIATAQSLIQQPSE